MSVPGIVKDVNGFIEELKDAVVLIHSLDLLGVQKLGVPQIACTFAVDEEIRNVLHVDGNGECQHAVRNASGAILRVRWGRHAHPVDGEVQASILTGIERCVE